MANPNPKTDQLALGRGKRPKLDNQTVGMRMSKQTRQNLEKLAEAYGCLYGGKPWIAGLLSKIASGELLIVPAPAIVLDPKSAGDSSQQPFNSSQAIAQHMALKHYHGSPEQTDMISPGQTDDSEPASVS